MLDSVLWFSPNIPCFPPSCVCFLAHQLYEWIRSGLRIEQQGTCTGTPLQNPQACKRGMQCLIPRVGSPTAKQNQAHGIMHWSLGLNLNLVTPLKVICACFPWNTAQLSFPAHLMLKGVRGSHSCFLYPIFSNMLPWNYLATCGGVSICYPFRLLWHKVFWDKANSWLFTQPVADFLWLKVHWTNTADKNGTLIHIPNQQHALCSWYWHMVYPWGWQRGRLWGRT